uniref:Pectinesterase inhibitor domain-containing protein n=1 Tax=Leersia perrieri TaxID=77586 RepID=A0A0D9X4A6_9ORYZ
MNTIPQLVLLATTIILAVAGDDDPSCPRAPRMTVDSACRKASSTEAAYEMCKDALREIPNPQSGHDATAYALAAARRAMASERGTADAAFRLLMYNSSLSGDETYAYMECLKTYTTAAEAMGTVEERLRRCDFRGLGSVYLNGLIDVESCRNWVIKLPASPLYAMVLVDRNNFGLAFSLGKLLGASHTQATYQMCRDALREIPYPTSDAHDATVYALAAARRALASADATMDAAIKLLTYNHSLTGGEREAYSECVEAYTTAEHAVGRVISRLAACGFDGALAGDYMDGLIDVESCRDRVLRLTASPIYALVLVDRNRFGLALFLGKLLGI